MNSRIRTGINALSLTLLVFGSVLLASNDARADHDPCYACVDNCLSGMYEACQEQCQGVAEGCGINQLQCGVGNKAIECIVL